MNSGQIINYSTNIIEFTFARKNRGWRKSSCCGTCFEYLFVVAFKFRFRLFLHCFSCYKIYRCYFLVEKLQASPSWIRAPRVPYKLVIIQSASMPARTNSAIDTDIKKKRKSQFQNSYLIKYDYIIFIFQIKFCGLYHIRTTPSSPN